MNTFFRIILVLCISCATLTSKADGFRCSATCGIVHPWSWRVLKLGMVNLAADVSRTAAFEGLGALCIQQVNKLGIYGEPVLLKSSCSFDKNIPPQTPLPYTGDREYLP